MLSPSSVRILEQEKLLRKAIAREARHKAFVPCCVDMEATASCGRTRPVL